MKLFVFIIAVQLAILLVGAIWRVGGFLQDVSVLDRYRAFVLRWRWFLIPPKGLLSEDMSSSEQLNLDLSSA